MNPPQSPKRRQRRAALLVILCLITISIGFGAGRWSMTTQYPMLKEPVFRNLDTTYKEIMTDYLDGAEASSLLHGAAEGMVESLNDPYSSYYTKEQGTSYLERYENSFVGIGLELRKEDGHFRVEAVVEGAPADQAGLLKDDIVTEINNMPLTGKTLPEIIQLTRGEVGSEVTLTIEREGMQAPFEQVLVRAAVPVVTVEYEMLEDGIGSIQIIRFSEDTAAEFDEAIRALEQQGMQALMLDLRMNPGGLLRPAIEIASRIVPKDEVIVQVVYKDDKHHITHRSKQEEPWELPMVVLVDENSASSAEVLAAALKDSAGIEIVGVKTFGKGIVQTFQQFEDHSVLKLTEAQWRRADGSWIQDEGIEPTVEVRMPDYASLPSLPSDIDISVGSFGQHVKTAEQLLETLGYQPGEPEGIFDEETKAAVQRFQRDEGLPVDGVLSGRSSYRLVERVRDKVVREDPQHQRAVELLTG
ncbi:S41 family peptidase [Paenibacillus daejeonensis]|uniref:S41 family peptidase n=1 Tax=Paenibacillus daejeonensis TaxID=135193 RepID=UPI00036F7677|nr:S41 family peptidase [Paenibacillus daejeonensis]